MVDVTALPGARIFGTMGERDEGREVPVQGGDDDRAGDREAVATRDAASDELDPGGELREAARSLETELERARDRLLRLQAEFDNFRKREARERAAAWARAKADLSQKLLAAIDDLQRVAELDPEETPADAVIEGVSLVERKLLDGLEREGLSSVGEVGEAFDPNLHEAIGTRPTDALEQDGRIAAVASRGYRFGSRLLRPAQVQVFEFREEGASPS